MQIDVTLRVHIDGLLELIRWATETTVMELLDIREPPATPLVIDPPHEPMPAARAVARELATPSHAKPSSDVPPSNLCRTCGNPYYSKAHRDYCPGRRRTSTAGASASPRTEASTGSAEAAEPSESGQPI